MQTLTRLGMVLGVVLGAAALPGTATAQGTPGESRAGSGPGLDWMAYVGGGGSEWGAGVAVHGDLVYLGGYTSSPDFEGRTNSLHGTEADAFVARVDGPGQIGWMTYLGGTSFEIGKGAAVDSAGGVLITGWTSSDDFEGANNEYQGGSLDAFVARLHPDGTLDWATYLGGNADDYALDIALDASDNAYITGQAYSTDFTGRVNTHRGGVHDAFVARVGPDGVIDWMRYLGGSGGDIGDGIAVDLEGHVVVAGDTWSSDYEGRVNAFRGVVDATVIRVSPDGTLDWMAYLGGTGEDVSYDVAIAPDGGILTSGATTSTNFFGKTNDHHGGNTIDASIARLGPGGQIEWMTYLGGQGDERGLRLVADADGTVIAGITRSFDFEGRDNNHHGGGGDAYLGRVSATGAIEWMTYLGGSDDEGGFGIAIDAGRGALLTGRTNSLDFEGRVNAFRGGDLWGDAYLLRVQLGCRADFNDDGQVNTMDVLAFLNAWSSGDPRGDFNDDGAINTLDVLAFLNAWSGGC